MDYTHADYARISAKEGEKPTVPQPAPEVCPLCLHEDWRDAEGRCGALEQDGCNEGDVSRCGCHCVFPPAPERRSSVWHTVHYKCTDCGYQSSAPAQVGEFTNCGNCGSTFLAPQTPAAAPAPQPAAPVPAQEQEVDSGEIAEVIKWLREREREAFVCSQEMGFQGQQRARFTDSEKRFRQVIDLLTHARVR